MQYVAYYRVSTQMQGKSGLGLEAQKSTCKSYNPIAEFIEVESGKNDDRAELHKAMEFAKTNKATLIVAKLDRLSRKASFIMNLMDDGFKFRCADIPNADEFQLHLFAILAQKERKMISERTSEAIQAKIAQGREWGTNKQRVERANSFAEKLTDIIRTLKDSGIGAPAAIARELNNRGIRTPRGAEWGPGQIVRLLNRIG